MKIQLRFNTDKLRDDSLLPWRVIVDGKQQLAEEVHLCVEAHTSVDEIAPGVLKWHVTCEGVAVWDGAVCKVVQHMPHMDTPSNWVYSGI
jgi:hypothetical protein